MIRSMKARPTGWLVMNAARQRAAIEHRHHGLDFAPCRAQREIDEILGAGEEIGVRKLLEQHDEVAGRDALFGKVAVQVVFRANHCLRADDLPRPGQQVALAILIAIGNHGPVQAEQSDIDGQGGPELVQDFIAQAFERRARDEAGGLGPGAGALDQREAFLRRAAPGRDDGSRAERRRIGVSARRGIEGAFERRPVHRQRREGVRLGRQRADEHAHC